MNKPRLIVKLKGGLVSNIISNQDIDVMILDADIHDTDPDDFNCIDNKAYYITKILTEHNPDFVNHVFEK